MTTALEDRDAGSFGKLYRSADGRILFGVCAGLADYFGVERWIVRVFWFFGLLILPPPTIVAYLVLAMLLPKAPARRYASAGEADFWQGVRIDPSRSFGELRHRFRELERKLRRAEAFVTSKRYRVQREIDDLDR
ncbi:MAG: envelope stress response membrane protein PspC [Rhodospirillales bacterium]|nr:envelope stress response membrane protein PspC [Rhodospirillales bacterium]